MVGRRKFRYVETDEAPYASWYEQLCLAIQKADLTDKSRRVMVKDAHLVAAALCTDRIVVSLDNDARSRFSEFSGGFPQIGDVMWLSPAGDSERWQRWLVDGAPDDPSFRLHQAG